MGGASGVGPSVVGRVRSKTFEEYEKDTTDAWDDEEEEGDISQLSVPAELEHELQLQHREQVTSSDSGAATPTRKRVGSKGTKGVCPLVPACLGPSQIVYCVYVRVHL